MIIYSNNKNKFSIFISLKLVVYNLTYFPKISSTFKNMKLVPVKPMRVPYIV